MDFLQNINHLWLIAGAVLVIFEFFIAPGVGFLFAGLGAITVGALLQAGLINEQIWQWIIFLAATLVWLLVLYKPLARFKMSKDHKPFSDMVGRKAILVNSLLPGETGQVKWSGTLMNARLDPSVKESIAGGAEVVITHVEGNVVLVK